MGINDSKIQLAVSTSDSVRTTIPNHIADTMGTEFVKIANAGTWDFKISVLVRKEILRKCKFPDRKQTVYYYIRKSDVAQAINSGVFS